MKKTVLEFIRRGLVACGFGPLVLAVLYLILERHGGVQLLTVGQVCRGIFSLSALAFIAGGMNMVYQIERLPLMGAVLIHGLVLYISYLATYLLNSWLSWGLLPVMVFTVIFAVGYLVIWAVIFCTVHRKTEELNQQLRRMQSAEEP